MSKKSISRLSVAPAFPTGHTEIKPVIQDVSFRKKISHFEKKIPSPFVVKKHVFKQP